MYKIHLSNRELNLLALEEKKHRNRDIKRRLRTIRLRHQGVQTKEICKRLEVSPHAVTQWAKLYLEGGIPSLCSTNYHKRRTSSLDSIMPHIKAFIEHKEEVSTKELQFFISEKLGKVYDVSWVRKWRKKHDL